MENTVSANDQNVTNLSLSENISAKSSKVILPDGVAPEPRNEEELHLDLISHSQFLVDTYLDVSDDGGQGLGNETLEQQVKEFCERVGSVTPQKMESAETVLQEATDLAKRYVPALTKSGAIAEGIQTKYSIRLGTLFNIQKRIVRYLGRDWTKWFEENNTISLRSAQDYMALAKVPKIIRYAFLGKERLMEILRVIDTSRGEDPVGNFLREHGFDVDLESGAKENRKTLRADIEAIIATNLIRKVEEESKVPLELNTDLLKKLIRLGTPVEKGLIKDLVIIKQNGGDPNRYLERRYINGGEEEDIITSTKKLQGISKLAGHLKSSVDYLRKHRELIDKVTKASVQSLEEQVAELKALINES
jgi:hypothetical protein